MADLPWTLPVPKASDADPASVLAALGAEPPDAAVPAVGGFDTDIWRVSWGDRAQALRLFRAGEADRARQEAAAMAAAAAAGIPAPAVRRQGVWRGRPAMLMDWCEGEPVAAAALRCPEQAESLGRAFGRAQAAVHRAPPPPGLPGPERWLSAGDPPEALRRRIEEAMAGRPVALLHLDFHPLNVLASRGRVTGVIDWANAHSGDPRADLARTMTILRLDLAGVLDLRRPAAASAAVRFERGWRLGYGSAAGPGAALDLPPFLAWAGAAMRADLAGKRDAAFFRRVDAWTARWSERAGVRRT